MEEKGELVHNLVPDLRVSRRVREKVVEENGIKETREAEESHPESPNVALRCVASHGSTDRWYEVGNLREREGGGREGGRREGERGREGGRERERERESEWVARPTKYKKNLKMKMDIMV